MSDDEALHHSDCRRVLAFEPFGAGSHRAVRESITRHSRHTWTWISRPGRAWKWRMRLGAIEMLGVARERGLLDQSWDAIVTTSLLSAADLRALLPAALRVTPLILYMHENQAAYPAGRQSAAAGDRDVHFALTNLASVLAADRVIWNSAWNQRSFIDGMKRILAHAGDTTLRMDELAARIEARSEVIWPPVELPPLAVSRGASNAHARPDPDAEAREKADQCEAAGGDDGVLHKQDAVRIVWPHRWEHDKGPEELLALAEAHSRARNLRWIILGERYRDIPPPLERFAARFRDAIEHIGYVEDRDAYWRWLQRADWVLSTARHEFFGIAVVEALLAGCLPWLPGRLSYPELLPECAQGLNPLHPPGDPDRVRSAIRAHLEPAVAPIAVGRLDGVIDQVGGPAAD